jgi:tetratricopeptide (TPR) repeat protein
MKRLTVLAQAILAKTPQPKDILAALRSEPDNLELATALILAANKLPLSERAVALGLGLERSASAFIELDDLSAQTILDMPNSDRQEILERWKNGDGSDLVNGISALRILICEQRLEEADALAATLRAQFPDAANVIDQAELGALISFGHRNIAVKRLRPFVNAEIHLDPTRIFFLSLLFTRAASPCDAIAFHERVAREFEDFRPLSLVQITMTHLLQEEHQLALDAMDELQRISSPIAKAHEILRLRAVIGLGDTDAALQGVDQVLKCVRPNSLDEAMAHSLRGDCLRKLNRYSDAEAAYHAALKVRPRDINTLLGLSRCHEKQERWNEAYETLLAAATEAPELRERLQDHVRRLRAEARAHETVAE